VCFVMQQCVLQHMVVLTHSPHNQMTPFPSWIGNESEEVEVEESEVEESTNG
jgi:hypothetical protein